MALTLATGSTHMSTNATSVWRRLWKDRYAYLFLAPGYLVFFLVVFVPLVAGIWISLFRTDFITSTWVGLGNYVTLFTNSDFPRVLVNTLEYVIILVPSSVAISLVIALLINPLPSGWQSFFRGAFYLPGVVGGIVLTTVWLWIFDPTFGLANYVLSWFGLKPILWLASSRTSLFSVCVAVFFQVLGMQIILFLAGLANIPEELLDAARVDGANSWQVTWRIRLPLLRPVLAFVVAIETIALFQIWETIYLLTNGGPNDSSSSVVFMIYQTAFQFSQWGLGSAMAVVLMLIVIFVTLFQSRYWGAAEA
jgi:multiple sugar transport system permease protein